MKAAVYLRLSDDEYWALWNLAQDAGVSMAEEVRRRSIDPFSGGGPDCGGGIPEESSESPIT